MPCLLKIAPNDWLSPTDSFLNAHGIGSCGALAVTLPHSLVKLPYLTKTAVAVQAPLLVFDESMIIP